MSRNFFNCNALQYLFHSTHHLSTSRTYLFSLPLNYFALEKHSSGTQKKKNKQKKREYQKESNYIEDDDVLTWLDFHIFDNVSKFGERASIRNGRGTRESRSAQHKTRRCIAHFNEWMSKLTRSRDERCTRGQLREVEIRFRIFCKWKLIFG